MGVSVSCTTVPFRCFPCVQNRTEQNRAEQKGFCACPRSLCSSGAPSALAALLSPLLLLAGGCWTHGLWETGQSLPAGPGSRGAREHPRAAAPAAPVGSSVFLPAHGGVFGHIRHLVLPDPQGFLFPEASFVPGGEGQGIAGFIKEINALFPNIP